MKIIAFYLPQFHDIPENDEWWGKGFTEWDNVRKAKPLFDGHNQPRIPLNENYYNLLNDDVKIWQSEIAQEHGVYGFCYYHYWFNGKLLLEKPMEQMLKNKRITIPFCICWANEQWTKAWVGENKVLIAQNYGQEKEWEAHFNYLFPFLIDERYIYQNDKPLLVIYRPNIIPNINSMLDFWNELAKKKGLKGITFAYQQIWPEKNKDDSRFTYNIEFQPTYGLRETFKGKHELLRNAKNSISNFIERATGKNIRLIGQGKLTGNRIEYDKVWNSVLSQIPESEKSVPGAFVGWDNTPRHGKKGRVFIGDSPEKFENYLSKQIVRAREVYKKDIIFMYAWNEWAEGGYLEPDEKNGYKYLDAIKSALEKNDEL